MINKNRFFLYLLTLILLFSSSSYSIAIEVFLKNSKYKYTKLGEQLIDGSKSSINWFFTFNKSNVVLVNISSWHIPFSFNGTYEATTGSDGLISLTFIKGNNDGDICDVSAPQFLIKRTSNCSMEIKSKLFFIDGWRKLKKIKNLKQPNNIAL